MDFAAVFSFACALMGANKLPDSDYSRYLKMKAHVASVAVAEVYANGYKFKGEDSPRKPKRLFESSTSLDTEQRLILSIIFHESGFTIDAQRADGSCGYMQVMPMWLPKIAPGKTCADVKRDPQLAVYVGIEALRIHKDYCVNMLSKNGKLAEVPATYWLGAYASGKCGFVENVARELCEPAGACSEK